MSIIHKLPKELVEKIAAGEVVERPASVVKELMENALDAKATHITIELEEAGTKLIRVADNGCGMDATDLALSVEAHATSKISSADDLFAIKTLGFRGEALASICAVSKVDITSRQQKAIAANTIHVEGGVADPIKQVGSQVGTTIAVTDLFFNVPARRKFLKTVNTELQAITTLISNYCMVHPHVHFTLTHNGKQIINSPTTKNMIDKIGHIYGTTVVKQLLPVSSITQDITLIGYISTPSLTRADKKQFTFFLNGRFIKNPNLLSAVIEGYETLLMVGRNPVGVINIIVNPNAVDVNVHPSKDIVKFDHETHLLDVIKLATKQTLDQTNMLREHKEKETQQTIVGEVTLNKPTNTAVGTTSSQKNQTNSDSHSSSQTELAQPQIHKDTQTIMPASATQTARERVAYYQHNVVEQNAITTHAQQHQPVSVVVDNQSVFNQSPNIIRVDENLTLRYIGLLLRTYAICESKDGLVMIDFHAAHERYLYEQIKLHRTDTAQRTQALLSPLKIELTPAQLLLINEHQQLLESLGFIVDEFGGSTILVRSVPLLFHKQMNKQVLFDIIDELSEKSSTRKMDETLDKIMIRMSCRAADKAGDELSDEKIKEIIRQVSTAGHKYSCPHGRPIFLSVTRYELDKMFKRHA